MVPGRNFAAITLLVLILLCACVQTEETPVADSTPTTSPTLEILPPTSFPTITISPSTEVSVFYGPLSVVILQPADNTTVQESPVTVSGKADPGTVINLNDEVVLVGETGVFQSLVSLTPGMNMIEITASDFQNHQDYSYMTVFFETEP